MSYGSNTWSGDKDWDYRRNADPDPDDYSQNRWSQYWNSYHSDADNRYTDLQNSLWSGQYWSEDLRSEDLIWSHPLTGRSCLVPSPNALRLKKFQCLERIMTWSRWSEMFDKCCHSDELSGLMESPGQQRWWGSNILSRIYIPDETRFAKSERFEYLKEVLHIVSGTIYARVFECNMQREFPYPRVPWPDAVNRPNARPEELTYDDASVGVVTRQYIVNLRYHAVNDGLRHRKILVPARVLDIKFFTTEAFPLVRRLEQLESDEPMLYRKVKSPCRFFPYGLQYRQITRDWEAVLHDLLIHCKDKHHWTLLYEQADIPLSRRRRNPRDRTTTLAPAQPKSPPSEIPPPRLTLEEALAREANNSNTKNGAAESASGTFPPKMPTPARTDYADHKQRASASPPPKSTPKAPSPPRPKSVPASSAKVSPAKKPAEPKPSSPQPKPILRKPKPDADSNEDGKHDLPHREAPKKRVTWEDDDSDVSPCAFTRAADQVDPLDPCVLSFEWNPTVCCRLLGVLLKLMMEIYPDVDNFIVPMDSSLYVEDRRYLGSSLVQMGRTVLSQEPGMSAPLSEKLLQGNYVEQLRRPEDWPLDGGIAAEAFFLNTALFLDKVLTEFVIGCCAENEMLASCWYSTPDRNLFANQYEHLPVTAPTFTDEEATQLSMVGLDWPVTAVMRCQGLVRWNASLGRANLRPNPLSDGEVCVALARLPRLVKEFPFLRDAGENVNASGSTRRLQAQYMKGFRILIGSLLQQRAGLLMAALVHMFVYLRIRAGVENGLKYAPQVSHAFRPLLEGIRDIDWDKVAYPASGYFPFNLDVRDWEFFSTRPVKLSTNVWNHINQPFLYRLFAFVRGNLDVNPWRAVRMRLEDVQPWEFPSMPKDRPTVKEMSPSEWADGIEWPRIATGLWLLRQPWCTAAWTKMLDEARLDLTERWFYGFPKLLEMNLYVADHVHRKSDQCKFVRRSQGIAETVDYNIQLLLSSALPELNENEKRDQQAVAIATCRICYEETQGFYPHYDSQDKDFSEFILEWLDLEQKREQLRHEREQEESCREAEQGSESQPEAEKQDEEKARGSKEC